MADCLFESRLIDWSRPRLSGKPTALHMCKMFERYGGSPRGWLERWLREKGISSTDRVSCELRSLVEAVEEAGTFDQLNLGALACLEVLCRRVALLVDAHRNPSRPSYANAKFYTGPDTADELVSPEFRAHVVKLAKDDHDVNAPSSRGVAPAAQPIPGGPPPKATSKAGAPDKKGKGKGKGKDGATEAAAPAPAER